MWILKNSRRETHKYNVHIDPHQESSNMIMSDWSSSYLLAAVNQVAPIDHFENTLR